MTQKSVVDKLASQCVKCALCLPHCPTYELTKDENESPRGRIALFQAIAQEKLALTEKVQTHLDQCLGCRACERVCPAHVEYGQLLTFGRALMKELPPQGKLTPRSLTTRFLSWIVTKPSYQHFLHRLLWLLQITGLRRLAQALKIPSLLGLGELDALLPTVTKPIEFQPIYDPIGPKKGRVKLFTGCITSMCDQETLAASIYVLRHLGMEVHVPKQQTCCGAIASHSGDIQEAHRLAKQNCDAFDVKKEVDYIITTATGCSAVLQEYHYHFSSHSDSIDESLQQFSSKVIDIITFVQKCDWPTTFVPKSVPLKAFLHTPCTRRNVLKSPAEPAELLARIPELTVTSFTSAHCCGAAGTYMLDHPQLAKPLAEQLLKDLYGKEVNFIATSNVGCALHLAKELKKTNPTINIGHPITLLAKALGF